MHGPRCKPGQVELCNPCSLPMPACECMLLQSAEDTDAILAMCTEAGVQLMDGSMWIHSPRVKALQAAFKDRAAMGELITAHSIFHNIFSGLHASEPKSSSQGRAPVS